MASTASQLPTQGNTEDSNDSSTHFILIEPKPCRSNREALLVTEWKNAISLYFPMDPNPPFTVLEGKLHDLDANLLRCDCMVSPANSFGIMDGGYDDILSIAFKDQRNDYWTLTNHVQEYLKREAHGYLAPGSCLMVPLPSDLAGDNNPWKARFIAVIPTMRTPSNVAWHRDLVYNSMWTLQVAIENWNRDHPEGEPIRRVLMTGLATGCGFVPPKKCAVQMVLSVQQFLEPIPEQPRWVDVMQRDARVEATTKLTT